MSKNKKISFKQLEEKLLKPHDLVQLEPLEKLDLTNLPESILIAASDDGSCSDNGSNDGGSSSSKSCSSSFSTSS